MIDKNTKIILASASPRRKELLHMIYDDFEILTAGGEENAEMITPSQFVETLARQKAEQVIEANSFDSNTCYLIISADTIVYQNEKVLGKPKSKEEAFRMLSGLAGNSHEVYTGVCITVLENSKISHQKTFFEKTKVFFMPLTDDEINEYIETGEPFDKAGGYGIQGIFGKYIERIEGDFFNVMGLPVNHLYKEICKKYALLAKQLLSNFAYITRPTKH